MSLSDDLVKIIKNKRKYADFFEWPNRNLKERAIVECLLKSMKTAGEGVYSSPKICNDQWPDVVVHDQNGRKIAVEVQDS